MIHSKDTENQGYLKHIGKVEIHMCMK